MFSSNLTVKWLKFVEKLNRFGRFLAQDPGNFWSGWQWLVLSMFAVFMIFVIVAISSDSSFVRVFSFDYLRIYLGVELLLGFACVCTMMPKVFYVRALAAANGAVCVIALIVWLLTPM